MMRTALAGLLALAATLPAAAQKAPPDDNLDARFANGIVAIAEGKVITVDDIRHEIAPLIPEVQRRSRNEQELNSRLEQLQDEIVQTLIDRVLIVKDFRKDEKKRIPASYVDQQISETIINEFDGDRSKFLAYLRSRGLSQREYRKEVEEEIIYHYMRSQLRKSQSIVSPVRVEEYYAAHKNDFYQDEGIHLRLIQINRKAGEDDASLMGRAREVHQRLVKGESFEDLAKEVSNDSRRTKGGDWGWQKKTDLKKEFSEPLFNLSKGQFTAPILQQEAAYLLYVDDRTEAGVQPIEKVRDRIEQVLLTQMTREAETRWLEKLRRNGYVKRF